MFSQASGQSHFHKSLCPTVACDPVGRDDYRQQIGLEVCLLGVLMSGGSQFQVTSMFIKVLWEIIARTVPAAILSNSEASELFIRSWKDLTSSTVNGSAGCHGFFSASIVSEAPFTLPLSHASSAPSSPMV